MPAQTPDIEVGSFWVLSRPGLDGMCYKTGCLTQVTEISVSAFANITIRFSMFGYCPHSDGHLASKVVFLQMFERAKGDITVLEFLASILSRQ